MNGNESKRGIGAREWRWTTAAAHCVWAALKTFQPRHAAVLCRRRRTDLEAETLGRWKELNVEENHTERGGWIRLGEPDTGTRNPTLFVSILFSICSTDRFMDGRHEVVQQTYFHECNYAMERLLIPETVLTLYSSFSFQLSLFKSTGATRNINCSFVPVWTKAGAWLACPFGTQS